MSKESEVFSLTGLRLVSTFYMFLFHIRWPLTLMPLLKCRFDVRTVDMSAFFILSDFLLFLSYHDIKRGAGDYVVNRVVRIYSAYFLAGLMTLPWLNIPLEESIAETLTGLANMAFISVANLLVIQAWFLLLFSCWNSDGSRSISVEVLCYWLLPLMTLHLVKLSRAGLIRVLLFGYLLTFKVSLATRLYPIYGLSIFYAMPIFRLPELIIAYSIFNGSKLLALANFVALTCFSAMRCYLIEELVRKWIRTRWRERKVGMMALKRGGVDRRSQWRAHRNVSNCCWNSGMYVA